MSVNFLSHQNLTLSRLLAGEYDQATLADIVRNSPYFDEQWYSREYPEIQYNDDGCPDAAFHYTHYGFKESRLPGLMFDGNRYSEYHQLKDVNPLLHYLASGTPGDYRCHEREQSILVRLNDGLEITSGERALILEQSYRNTTGRCLNLCHMPGSLSEKILALRTWGMDKWESCSDLLNKSTLHATLREKYGFTEAQAPVPAAVVARASDIDDQMWMGLPESFYMTCNGAYGTNVNVMDKKVVNRVDLIRIMADLQVRATSRQVMDKLSSSRVMEPSIIIYSHEGNLNAPVHQDVNTIGVLCLNGRTTLLIHYGSGRTINLLDPDYKLLSSVMTADNGSQHKVAQDLTRPECLDEIKSKAELMSKNAPCLLIEFVCRGSEFSCREVLPDLDKGTFTLSNDQDLRLGATWDISSWLK
ncbi:MULTISPECIES: hypothetical protein [unclassified Anaerobiospirillum]|uniref:hypothetical protein n=1 Tax=unclassified Anaerobiospirillum TaxID=2647410 RepID=UPI001FF5D51A|nr:MULTISPECIES: hypothetical protein [unclassified Anaerobiospirillum]MCK0534114.1 hypothetical protein [Anaerobiospirillum sp. NML120511]MCK0539341.1 hypothetical protein [Anaerobiospirillum sp. NML02-A-032]